MTSVYVQPKQTMEEAPEGNTDTDTDTDTDEAEEEEPKKGLIYSLDEKRRAIRWQRLARIPRDLEARFNSAIRKHIHEIEEEVLANVEGTKGWLAAHTKGDEDWLGAPMYWSTYDSETNQRLVQEVGLQLIHAQIETVVEFGETTRFLWIVAQKPEEAR